MQLSGDITLANAHALWEALAPGVAGAAQIDVSAVTRVDSSALALILALRRRAGPQCRVVGFTSRLAALASVYDVEALFQPASGAVVGG